MGKLGTSNTSTIRSLMAFLAHTFHAHTYLFSLSYFGSF